MRGASSSLFVAMTLLLLTAAATEQPISENRIKSIEDVLSHIVIGPLHRGLRPAAFSQRNRTQVLQVQANHFRAHVLQNMLQSLEEHVEICPWPSYIGQEAISGVVNELKSLEFNVSWENKPHWRCPGYGGYLLIHVPVPEK